MVDQEKKLEDPSDETRIRFLEGNDMTPAQLKDKIQEVNLPSYTNDFSKLA